MLAAHHVLRLCRADGEGGNEKAWEGLGPSETPGNEDHATRSKRQRLPSSSSGGTSPSSTSPSSHRGGYSAQPQSVQCGPAAAYAAAPPSPAAAAPSGQPSCGVTPWQASLLFSYVQKCLVALVNLHPICAAIHDTRAAELACAIFRHSYLRRSPAARAALEGEQILAQATLAASFWLALKFVANRSTIPDAQLLYRITGIPSPFLRQQERDILVTLGWDLMTPAREVGAVGAADVFTDAVCQEQQAQLALLAQQSLPPALALAPHAPAAQQAVGLPPCQPYAHAPSALPAAAAAAMANSCQHRSQLAGMSLALLLAGSGPGRACPQNLLGVQLPR